MATGDQPVVKPPVADEVRLAEQRPLADELPRAAERLPASEEHPAAKPPVEDGPLPRTATGGAPGRRRLESMSRAQVRSRPLPLLAPWAWLSIRASSLREPARRAW